MTGNVYFRPADVQFDQNNQRLEFFDVKRAVTARASSPSETF